MFVSTSIVLVPWQIFVSSLSYCFRGSLPKIKIVSGCSLKLEVQPQPLKRKGRGHVSKLSSIISYANTLAGLSGIGRVGT